VPQSVTFLGILASHGAEATQLSVRVSPDAGRKSETKSHEKARPWRVIHSCQIRQQIQIWVAVLSDEGKLVSVSRPMRGSGKSIV